VSSPGFFSLPVGARRYLIATLVNMVGNGMMFAFVFIYLHDVRGYSGALTGWILASGTVATLLVTSFGGWLCDHIGAKRALIGANVLCAVVFGSYGFNSSVVGAFVMSILSGASSGLAFPAQQAFASVVVSPEVRPLMASWLRVLLNIGAGVGGALGGFITSVERPGTFIMLFLGNAATYVGYVLIVALIAPTSAPSLSTESGKAAAKLSGGYRRVLQDRFFVRLLLLDLAAGIGFGLVFLVMPTTFVKRLGGSERIVGLVTLIGAAAVVLAQIPVSRLVRGRSRMSSLGAMFVMFTLAFSCGVASVDRPLVLAIVIISIGQIAGGLGECFLGPVRNPLTAELAPPELMGRYFGLATMMFQGGFGFANVLGGVGLDISFRGLWAVGVVVMIAAVGWSLRLDRTIPHAVRLSP
jgi:MFS family permease